MACVAYPPDWRDDDFNNAVADWASREIDEADLESDRQFYTLRWDTHPGVPADEVFRVMEREAVFEAERGNFGPLDYLMQPDHPWNKFFKTQAYAQFMPSTRRLISERLTGRWKRKKRRESKKTGRPPMTEDERRAMNPIHDAGDEVRRVELILRDAYPDKGDAQIRGQAAHTVARRWVGEFRKIDKHKNIDNGTLREMLLGYVGLPPDHHRRPTQHPKHKS